MIKTKFFSIDEKGNYELDSLINDFIESNHINYIKDIKLSGYYSESYSAINTALIIYDKAEYEVE